MNNFEYCCTTHVVFGKGTIAKLPELIDRSKKILMIYGGGSIKKNGVYDQVKKALEGYNLIEFGGIEPNPKYETCQKAIELIKREGVEFLLAVGGGSTLDATKFISLAAKYNGDDAYEAIMVRGETVNDALPLGDVITLPATGSEMNNGAVISCHETKEKFAFRGDYPVFSILDPETTYSLPKHQIACSLADIVVHCFEQYMTTPGQSRVLDRWAEGVIATAMEVAPLVQADQHNYDVMADYMYSATMALNNFIRMGVTQDWSTHQIGHELTALCGVTHGESLAIVYPGTAEVLREQKKAKLLQFGERVLGIREGSEDERVDQVIARIEAFFKSLGLATRLSEKGIGVDVVEEIARRFNERGVHFGEAKNVTGDVAREILMKRL